MQHSIFTWTPNLFWKTVHHMQSWMHGAHCIESQLLAKLNATFAEISRPASKLQFFLRVCLSAATHRGWSPPPRRWRPAFWGTRILGMTMHSEQKTSEIFAIMIFQGAETFQHSENFEKIPNTRCEDTSSAKSVYQN